MIKNKSKKVVRKNEKKDTNKLERNDEKVTYRALVTEPFTWQWWY